MVLLAANCIPVVVNHLLMTFYAVKTPHNCRVSYFKIFAGGCGTIFRLGAAVGHTKVMSKSGYFTEMFRIILEILALNCPD